MFLVISAGLELAVFPQRGQGATVDPCTESALRAAVSAGGQVSFGCDGIVALSGPLIITNDVTVDGVGRTVSISGSNAVRLFEVPAGRQLTLRGLVLAHGSATNGGAIFNRGQLEAISCVFSNNSAAGLIRTAAGGGAVWNLGTARLIESRFITNTATGGPGTGGAVFTSPGGSGRGGAILNEGLLTISNCLFRGNVAVGGLGGSSVSVPTQGGPGLAGALYNGHTATLWSSTFAGNRSQGGVGGISTLAAAGGDAFGGSIVTTGQLAATNCTFFGNEGVGGLAGRFLYPDGHAFGGSAYVPAGSAAFAFSTFANNRATNGGSAFYVTNSAVVELTHDLLSANEPGPSIAGLVMDHGHNVSSVSDPALTNSTSAGALTLRLGPLANNGGPTPTLALRTGSEAIDRGAGAGLSADQRNYPRPAGARLDPGAYEGSLGPLESRSSFVPAGPVGLSMTNLLRLEFSNTNNQSVTGIRLTNRLSDHLVVADAPLLSPGFSGVATISPDRQTLVLTFSLSAGGRTFVEVPVATVRVGVAASSASPIESDQFGIEPSGNSAALSVYGPPLAGIAAATEATFTSIRLNGFANPGGDAAVLWFEYGAGQSFDRSTLPAALVSSFSESSFSSLASGLVPGTDYSFRLVASNQFGITRSAPGTFFTLGDVNACDDAHLRANLARGGSVRMGCNGIITVTSPLVIGQAVELDGAGHLVTIGGAESNRVFEITSGGALILRGLTITQGRSDMGGGLLNWGRLILDRCVVNGNAAAGTNGAKGPNGASAPIRPPNPPSEGEPGRPGGIGGTAVGGGLANYGWCYALDSIFSGNSATGGSGGAGGDAGRPNVSGGIFTPGGQGGRGGLARGGGIHSEGTLILSNSCLVGNLATGGAGGIGGYNYGFGTAPGGSGGPAFAGGLDAGTNAAVDLVNVTVSGNLATGGAAGGLVQNANVNGGPSYGGGLVGASSLRLFFCTVASNRAEGGAHLDYVLFPGGAILSADGPSFGGNLFGFGSGPVLNSVVLAHAANQTNVFGALVDAGHNLSSDASVIFTDSTSLSSADPHLGPLANHGGPTPTHALLFPSPALDAGQSVAPATDQRGQPRPAVRAPDIGAFELQPTAFGLQTLTPLGGDRYRLLGVGLPNTTFRVLGSNGDGRWTSLAAGVVTAQGAIDVEVIGAAPFQILRTSVP